MHCHRLSGRQYQLLDIDGKPFGPCLIIAHLEANGEWSKSKNIKRAISSPTDEVAAEQLVDDSTRNSKLARAGNRVDVCCEVSSDVYIETSTFADANEAALQFTVSSLNRDESYLPPITDSSVSSDDPFPIPVGEMDFLSMSASVISSLETQGFLVLGGK